ncbi:putative exported protein, partial [Vibrio parahaemolyticus V-223/04]
TKVTAGTTT